jgi:hypothetical protein
LDAVNPSVRGFLVERLVIARLMVGGLVLQDRTIPLSTKYLFHRTSKLVFHDSSLFVPIAWNYPTIDAVVVDIAESNKPTKASTSSSSEIAGTSVENKCVTVYFLSIKSGENIGPNKFASDRRIVFPNGPDVKLFKKIVASNANAASIEFKLVWIIPDKHIPQHPDDIGDDIFIPLTQIQTEFTSFCRK